MSVHFIGLGFHFRDRGSQALHHSRDRACWGFLLLLHGGRILHVDLTFQFTGSPCIVGGFYFIIFTSILGQLFV